VWVGAHAAAAAAPTGTQERSGGTGGSTNGAIAGGVAATRPPLPGDATARAVVRITGAVHEVSTADRRVVEVTVVPA